MPAPYLETWAPIAKIAANAALLATIDAASTAAKVTIHDANDVLLATIPLATPAGVVSETTGELTLVMGGREDSAPNGGEAAYATIRIGDNDALHSLPCISGLAAVVGKCVLNTVTVIEGNPVELVSWSIL